MPTRRPDGSEERTLRDYESLADRRIREAAERGEFDDLPGAGRPLRGLSRGYDPDWWAKGFVRREKARDRADELRQMIRSELPRLRVHPDRAAAVGRVAELNRMVDAINEHLGDDDRVPLVEL